LKEISLPVLILISIPEAVLLAILGLNLIGIRATIKQVFSIGILQALCSYLIRLIPLSFGFMTILQLISFSIVVCLVMLIPLKISFLTVLLGLCFYASIEALSVSLLVSITGLNLQAVLENVWLRFAFFFPEAIIMAAAIFLINRLKIRLPESWLDTLKNTRESLNKYYPFIIFFLFQILLFTLFYLTQLLATSNTFDFKTFLSNHYLVIALITMMPILIITLVKRVISLLESEIETKAQLFTFNQVEDLLKTLRSQRHNFNHDLQVMYGLLEVEAFQEAKEYIQSGMKEMAAASELVKTDNLGVTALLYAKMGVAEGRNISLNVYVNTSLKKLPIGTRDANLILGNLIDNALEAVTGLPADNRGVEVMLSQDLDGYLFEVTNYGLPMDSEVINRLFEAGFSTKGPERGMGLYGVKKIVDKYDGNIDVTSNIHRTTFKVSIPI
jgi:signal transduction histidine kinase